MQNSLKQFSEFVGEMNAIGRHTDAQELARWGVNQLSETVGFDSAWYGWAEIKTDGVDIHAQASHNLTDNFYNSWQAMSEQDLLAAAVRKNPKQTAVYDRCGNTQTDGMISLADNHGLKKMATAMHVRPGRTTSFYLSSYRGGQRSRMWSADELTYLQCAVDHMSSAMRLCVAHKDDRDRADSRSIFVDEDGIVILGLQNVQELLGSLWPKWKGDQLPDHLRNLISIPGEHVLVDRQIIVTCQANPEYNDMGLRELSLRNLTKFDLLTMREREVARLLSDGNSHKEAARVLGVAPATVRNQTQSIYTKLGVKSRAELALEVKPHHSYSQGLASKKAMAGDSQ